MPQLITPDDFRRHGRDLIEWIARYWEDLENLPVTPAVAPGDTRAGLPAAAPDLPGTFAEALADLDRVVKPALVHWQAPGFFAYFPANTSFASILGDLAASGMAQQGMLWSTSPATTEVESHVLDWLVDLLGLPESWKTTAAGGGVLQMSASDSTHTSLVVARQRARARAPVERLVVYASTQAHSSIEKGARVAGYEQVRLVPTDDRHAMSPAALEEQIAADIAGGLVPAFVCSTVGTTGTTAVDPVRSIGEIAGRHGLWHHVDAAYAGSAMICPEFRHHQDSLELVDSYTFNPHKWLLTGFDCSVFYVADRKPLVETLSILPPYLQNEATASGAVIDYRDWHVPLGRRFRALKLWFVLRLEGAEALRRHIREGVRMARWFADQVDRHPALERIAPVPFGLVCFAHVEGNERTDALIAAINASGHSFVTGSRLDGRSFVRVAVGSTTTEPRHVERLWDLVSGLA